MEKLALDTSFCIELFRGNPAVTSFLRTFSKETTYVPAMTCFELLSRTYNLRVVESFIKSTNVLGFDESAARKAAEITKNLYRRGIVIGFQDIFIAATAIVNNCSLATLNVKDFSKIDGLKLFEVS